MPDYRIFVILLMFFVIIFQPGGALVAQSFTESSRPEIVNEFIAQILSDAVIMSPSLPSILKLNLQGAPIIGDMHSWHENASAHFKKECCNKNVLKLITPAQLYEIWHNTPEELEILDIRSKDKIEDYNPFGVDVQDSDNDRHEQFDADKQVVIICDDTTMAIDYARKLPLHGDNIIRILQGGLGNWWYYSKLKSLNLLPEENLQLFQLEDEPGIAVDNNFEHLAAQEGENANNE